MKPTPSLIKRELKSIFSHPIILLVLTVLAVGHGFYFKRMLQLYTQMRPSSVQPLSLIQNHLNFSTLILMPLYSNYAIFFGLLTILLTMSQISGEKRSGHWLILKSLPISEGRIVFAKLCATVIVCWSMLALVLLYPLLLSFHISLEWPVIINANFGLALFALFAASLGLFASSLSPHPLIAPFASLAIFMVMDYSQLLLPTPAFSPFYHLFPFLQGIFNPIHLLYYLSIAFLFFTLTEARCKNI